MPLAFSVLEADLSTEVIFSLQTKITLAARDDRFDNNAIPFSQVRNLIPDF
jgi:hypothetical protein